MTGQWNIRRERNIPAEPVMLSAELHGIVKHSGSKERRKKEEHFYASMEFTRTARSGSTAIILEKDRTVMCLSVTM